MLMTGVSLLQQIFMQLKRSQKIETMDEEDREGEQYTYRRMTAR